MNPREKTVHGYNYKVRIWYPNAPENKTEGTILAAYEEDLAKQIQLQYPGVTYEIISKDPVLGDPGPQQGQGEQQGWVWQDTGGGSGYWYNTRTKERRWAGKGSKPQGNPGPGQRQTLHRAIAPGNAEPNKTHYFCQGCKSPLRWCEKHNMYHHAFSFSPECMSVDNPGAADNLRDRLIAEIIKNRSEAWKRGVIGVRPWSENDLTELRSMTTEELEQTAKLTTQLSFAPSGQSQGDPQQPNCPQCGIPMTWKVNLFVCPRCQRHYDVSALQKAGIMAIPPIEGQSQSNLGAGNKIEIAHEQREEAGGVFDLHVHSDQTWTLVSPAGIAEGSYDQYGVSYEAKHQHPIIAEWINEVGEVLFGKVPSGQIDTELEQKAQQNWDRLGYKERRDYLMDYVEKDIPGSQGYAGTTWQGLPNNIKDFIRHAYARTGGEQRYVVEAEVTNRRIFYVTAENEEDAKQKIRNRDYHDEREKGDYWWEFKFTEVRPARPDESQYYP